MTIDQIDEPEQLELPFDPPARPIIEEEFLPSAGEMPPDEAEPVKDPLDEDEVTPSDEDEDEDFEEDEDDDDDDEDDDIIVEDEPKLI